jgi:tyrosyl-tRNA synthetase
LLYPIMQGYDSVCMAEQGVCDIEFGGTDQTFNCLMGRQLMQARGMAPQIVITFPLLEGLDGVVKMSKSKGNYIGVEESAENMFGKTMSIPDSMLERWFTLLTTVEKKDWPSHPMEAKKMLAGFITARFHGESAAVEARGAFENRFSKREMPTDLAEITVTGAKTLVDVVVGAGFAASKSEARRLVEQGGVKVDGVQKKDPGEELAGEFVLAVGKLKVGRVRVI